MAKWTFTIPTWTPVAVADTVAMTNAGYQTLQGGSATQVVQVLEVYMGGQAGASSPSIMMVARDSTFAGTPGALAGPNGLTPMNPATAALAAPPLGIISGTTNPQRSATSKLLNLSFNVWGNCEMGSGTGRRARHPGQRHPLRRTDAVSLYRRHTGAARQPSGI